MVVAFALGVGERFSSRTRRRKVRSYKFTGPVGADIQFLALTQPQLNKLLRIRVWYSFVS